MSISVRELLFGMMFLTMVGCAWTGGQDGADNKEGANASAAEGASGEEGLSDEPLGEGESAANATDAKGANSATAATPATAEKSLFERIGGQPTLEAFASKFIDNLAANPELQKNPNIAGALKSDQTRHKQMLTEFFCAKAGGPCAYGGRPIGEVHSPLKVTKQEWNVLRKVFIRTLREIKVPKKERKELAIIAARQKKQIISVQ